MGKVIGKSIKRLEDPALLRGQGRYIDDMSFPGMLEAAFVRSPHGHAEIDEIDVSMALELPGVHAIYTLNDLKPLLRMERLIVGLPSSSYRQDRNRPVLSAGEVVYVGEPVAIVIADNRYIAEDAAALVFVDYDILPTISDCRDAMAPDAPTAHKDAKDNLLAEFDMGYGDVDAAFVEAEHVFSDSLFIHRGGGHSIECRGAIAAYDPMSDLLTLWTSSQMPHATLRVLVDVLGRDENQIRVRCPDIGGGFGPKLIVYQEEAVLSVTAMMLQRPIKWIEDRREHFISSTQERDQYWEIEIAVDGDAKIQGIRGSIIHDHGAYTARGVNLAQNSAETVTGNYIVPNFAMNVKVALTNKVPVTPVRGAGHPQGVFAMERMLDLVARNLELDRAEVRRRNLIPVDMMPYTKKLNARGGKPVELDSGDYLKCQQDALDAAEWQSFKARQKTARAQGRYIGIGMANFVKGTGRGPFEAVTVRIGTSGKIHVYTGGSAIGQGTKTMLAQIVGEHLGGDLENISVTTGDTGTIALGIGTSNSRLTVTAGSSAHVAAQKVRAKALKVASAMLGIPEDDLDIEGSEIRVKSTSLHKTNRRLTLGEIAHSVAGTPGYSLPGGVEPGMEATEHVVIDSETFANGTVVAEVEVDIDTGGVEILNYVLQHDCGILINPMIVEGQLIGATAHGLGNTLFEMMGYDEMAQPLTTNYADYLMITAPEMPRIKLAHHQSPSPLNPLGVKGVGECGVIPVPAAVISAIEDALSDFNVHLNHAPISPYEIVDHILNGKRDRS